MKHYEYYKKLQEEMRRRDRSIGWESGVSDIQRELKRTLPENTKEHEGREKPQVVTRELDIHNVFSRLIQDEREKCATRVSRTVGDKTLQYWVIDGEKVKEHLPMVFLNIRDAIQEEASRLFGEELVPLHDRAAININIVEPGDQQGFHVDRNEVTYILYLTTTLGGELEYKTPENETNQIRTRYGTLVGLIGADKIPHRVTPVEEGKERVALVFSFGKPGKDYADPERDDFLYTETHMGQQKVFD